jgi:hypothetical protein
MLSLSVYLVLFPNVSCFYIQHPKFNNIQISLSTLRFHCSPTHKQHPKFHDIQIDGRYLSLRCNMTIGPSRLLGISSDPFFCNPPDRFPYLGISWNLFRGLAGGRNVQCLVALRHHRYLRTYFQICNY